MSYSTQICFLLHVPARPDPLDLVCLALLHTPFLYSKKKNKTAGLETTSLPEHNPPRFLHPFSGQTAHLQRRPRWPRLLVPSRPIDLTNG